MRGLTAIRTMGAVFVAVIVMLGCILPAAIVPARANQNGIPQSVDELLTIYGIADQPADFVVVVDTSGSMMWEPAIYPQVRAVYQDFTRAIADHDHLAVITFDTNAIVRFNGDLIGDNRAAAEAALPEDADGETTDIGGALDAALSRLERPDGAQVQTLIFLTDGEIVAPGSPYEQRGTAAWQELTARAQRLSASRAVSVYGAGVGGRPTDVGSLKDVFPRAIVVDVPADQLAEFFSEAVMRARVEQLRLPVTQELERNSIHVEVDPGRLDDTTELTLTFESTLPNLGATVNLSNVTVTDAAGTPLRANLVGGQRAFTLGPSERSEPIQVTVQVPDLDHSFRIGTVPDSRDFLVSVAATTEAEPAAILGQELGIEATPQISAADLATAERQHGTPYWMFGVALAILALFVLFLRWVYRRFIGTPNLRGGLEHGATMKYYPLKGKRVRLPTDLGLISDGSSAAVIFTRPRKFTSGLSARHPAIFIKAENGSPMTREGVLSPSPTRISAPEEISLDGANWYKLVKQKTKKEK